MGFVFEKVPEKDYEFFRSIGLKNCWGNKLLHLSSSTKWCADRDRNAFLVGIGDGYKDMPNFYALWWNEYTIIMEVLEAGDGNYDSGVNIVWDITRIPIPEEILGKRDEILILVREAFLVYSGWCNPEYLKSIDVKALPHRDCASDAQTDFCAI